MILIKFVFPSGCCMMRTVFSAFLMNDQKYALRPALSSLCSASVTRHTCTVLPDSSSCVSSSHKHRQLGTSLKSNQIYRRTVKNLECLAPLITLKFNQKIKLMHFIFFVSLSTLSSPMAIDIYIPSLMQSKSLISIKIRPKPVSSTRKTGPLE